MTGQSPRSFTHKFDRNWQLRCRRLLIRRVELPAWLDCVFVRGTDDTGRLVTALRQLIDS